MLNPITLAGKVYRIKKVADKMLDLKNIHTENMFFKEQLMRPGELAAYWRISNC